MREQNIAANIPKIPTAARIFLALLERIAIGHLNLITPCGEHYVFGHAHLEPAATLHLHDWRACGRILAAGDIGFAETYRQGWVDSPNLTAVLCLAICNQEKLASVIHGGWLAQAWYGLLHRLRPNTRNGSRQNIHAHYDIGNDFYGLWLDPSWTYSSGLFESGFNQDLAAAQAAKYQRIIDTLALRPGMRVLEIGCGWGGFAEYAARQKIHVYGITVSPSQLAFAQQRLRDAGLDDIAQLALCDYRDLDGQYDAIVSIEMFEAVGQRFWPAYFDTIKQRLRPGGRAVIQTIAIGEAFFSAYQRSSDFIREFIFPGGMLPSPERFIDAAHKAHLHTVSQFSFGPHYAHTLREWRARFENQLHNVAALGLDEKFIRTWRLYLCYCEAGFDERKTDVFQFELQRI